MRRHFIHISDKCSILKSSTLRLTNISGSEWIDSISGNNVNLIKSNAFKFNGTDNYIDTGSKVTGQTPIYFEQYLEYTATTGLRCFNGCGSYLPTGTKGIMWYVNNNIVSCLISDAVSREQITTTFTLADATIYLLTVSWSGIAGDDITFTVNGSSQSYATTLDWVGDSFSNLFIGSYTPTVGYIITKYMYVKYTTNNNAEKYIPFAVEEDREVWCVNTDAKLIIEGTVNATNHVTQNVFHYNYNEGFSFNGTARIPASQLNLGKDTEGNDLTNPAVKDGGLIIGHNNSETLLVWPDVAALKLIDTNNILYDGGGTPKELAFADIPSESGGYFYCNVIGASNDKRQIVLFDPPLTVDKEDKVFECYSKAIELSTGEAFVINANGRFIFDDITEQFIIKKA